MFLPLLITTIISSAPLVVDTSTTPTPKPFSAFGADIENDPTIDHSTDAEMTVVDDKGGIYIFVVGQPSKEAIEYSKSFLDR